MVVISLFWGTKIDSDVFKLSRGILFIIALVVLLMVDKLNEKNLSILRTSKDEIGEFRNYLVALKLLIIYTNHPMIETIGGGRVLIYR